MEWWAWGIGIFGLIVSAVGTLLLYFGTPLDSTGHTLLVETRVFKNEDMPEDKAFRKRHMNTKIGIVMIGIGFLIQLGSHLMNMPT